MRFLSRKKLGVVGVLVSLLFCLTSLSFLSLLIPRQSRAEQVYRFIIQKQEDKEKYRWNLTDWINTRDRIRLMDLWLALHSPAPYEFFLGTTYQINQTHAFQNYYNVIDGTFAAFVTIFGLEGSYEKNFDTRWTGSFDLRVFGYHDQSTNITLQGGLRYRSSDQYEIRNAFAGVRMTIYLAKAFGIEGLFRRYFDSTPTTLPDVGQAGNRYQAGAFLEYNFLRLYGAYFIESEPPNELKGTILGLKFYF